MDVATKLVAIRVDERLVQRLEEELRAERERECEPLRLSGLMRRLMREALDHRRKKAAL
jgi:hypothetical protein